MMLKNFLFDLDGTLLPMDLKPFIELYLQAFCKRFADPMQLDPQKLVQGIWDGAVAMGKTRGILESAQPLLRQGSAHARKRL